MFLKVGGPAPKQKTRLYVMEITLLSGITIAKCGKSSGASSKERLMQICASIYDKYRYTPKMKLCRDKEVDADVVFQLENTVHKFFKDYQYQSKTRWDGITECFVVPTSDMIDTFDLITEGQVPSHTYVLPTPVEDELPF